jgi:sugar lactone lactonase YvrE
VKRTSILGFAALVAAVALPSAPPAAQAPAPPRAAAAPQNAPKIPFKVVYDFLKNSPDMNLGEVLGVAVNSKGGIVVLNHPGTATSGPLYGNATTQLWEFDQNGKFVREIGKGVYGLGYAHSVRFDRYDNLWVVDKGTDSVMKFNPAGYVTMNLGRRPEGYEGEHTRPAPDKAVARDGYFNGVTDVGWDQNDNIYISDGYVNSRVAKYDKNGTWIKSFGTRGTEPGQFRLPHNLQVDRQGNVYVADRGNRRIQVFDADGNFKRVMLLNVPYDKMRHPVLGNLSQNRPDETAPWTLCISQGPTQHLYATDEEPGRLYKMTLEGKILGTFGESGRQAGQFNWAHGVACRSDDTIYVADMNNWRVAKLILQPEGTTTSR